MGKASTAVRLLRHGGPGLLARFILNVKLRAATVSYRGWRVPPGGLGYWLPWREEGVKAFIAEYRPKTFIAAGAWPCEYLALAYSLGARLTVGFEPYPPYHDYCLRFLQANREPRGWRLTSSPGSARAWDPRTGQAILLYNKALTDREGPLAMEPGEGPGQARVTPAGRVRVPATRLDRVRLPLLGPCLVLLDVEGHELQALQGARGLWNRCSFIIEVWPGNKDRYSRHLERYGFERETIWRTPDGMEYWFLSRGAGRDG